jgi:membrane-bound lytic murein transglycosylase B
MRRSPLRKFFYPVFAVGCYAVLVLFFTGSQASGTEPAPSIEQLKVLFKGKGYKTDHLFSDPRFTIYADIDSLFIKSAEKTRVDERLAAQERGDSLNAERIFREEYENYKIIMKFQEKTDSLIPFMLEHEKQLFFCEQKYCIPREVLAAVIGIESGFGNHRGNFNAFNVYVSMYMKNYRRPFAYSQLLELLAFCKRTGIDMFDINSSYAGAIGYMQFLPYSLNRWFVGKDVYNMDDAIISTANFLAYFKKRRGTVEKALYAYNPSRYYVTFVLDLADTGRAALKMPPTEE